MSKRAWRIAAYVVVVVAFIVAIVYIKDSFVSEREARTNNIIASVANGAADSCIRSNENVTLALHRLLYASTQQQEANLHALQLEGTLSATQVVRIRAQSAKDLKKLLSTIPYTDCNRVAARYIAKVSNPVIRRQTRIVIARRVELAKRHIANLEAEAKQATLPRADNQQTKK